MQCGEETNMTCSARMRLGHDTAMIRTQCDHSQSYDILWLDAIYNMTVWILVGSGINFFMAWGLIRLHRPDVR